MKKLYVFPADQPWQVRLRFSFDRELKDALKIYPGVSWKEVSTGEEWVAPREAVGFIVEMARKFGHLTEFYLERTENPLALNAAFGNSLWPFQQTAQEKALSCIPTDNGFIFNFDPQLGKTITCLATMQAAGFNRAIVACPSIVRKHWHEEIERWWHGHPEITEITDGKLAAAHGPLHGITLVSYGLLPKLPRLEADAIIFDELHYLQGEFASRTLASVRVLRDNPHAWRAGLTGTLIANHPLSLWKPLDVLWPGRFGTRNRFGARYGKTETNEKGFGNRYVGANDTYAEELKARLGLVSARATKLDPEIAKLLPPLIPVRAFTNKTRRFADSAQAALDAMESGATKAVVLTHLRDSVDKILASLYREKKRGYPIWHFTGEEPQSKREKMLDEWLAADRGMLVCTMHCVGIGIDTLAEADDVTFAELDFSPTQVGQAFGRFAGLSGNKKTTVRVLLDENHDPVGESLLEKLRAASTIIRQGRIDKGLEDILMIERPQMKREEINQLLSAMAKGMETI